MRTTRITLNALTATMKADSSAGTSYGGRLGPGLVPGNPAHQSTACFVHAAFDESCREGRAFAACLILDSALPRDDRNGEKAILVPDDLATLEALEREIALANFRERSAWNAIDADFGECVVLPVVQHLRRQAEIRDLFPELAAA